MVDTESNPTQSEISEKSTEIIPENSLEASSSNAEIESSSKDVNNQEIDTLAQSVKDAVLNDIHSVEESIQALKDLIKDLSVDKKATAAVDAMRYTLEKGKTSTFKLFWDVRKLCLDLFKEKISPAVRANLWNQFRELSKEAKLLKEVLDEDSAFAVEQLDIAITSLADEITNYQPLIKDAPVSSLKDISSHIASFRFDLNKYKVLQKEIALLNTFAVRVKSLRKELIETEMRIRQKNQFFEKLSNIGDAVFPRRKELISELSDVYMNDVEFFVTQTYPDVKDKVSPFHIRETIKSLQSLAKALTVDPKTFKKTRTDLSKCWDELKLIDKEKRLEQNEKRAEQQEQFDAVYEQVKEALALLEKEGLTDSELSTKVNDLYTVISEVRFVRSFAIELKNLMKPLEEKLAVLREEAQQELQRKQEEKRKLRLQQIEDFKNQLEALMTASQEMSYEDLKSDFQIILEKKSELKLSRFENMDMESKLFELKSAMTKRHEEYLLALPEKDQLQLQNLESILSEKQEQLAQLKDKIDNLRRQKSASGLDFERALQFEEILNQQKELYQQLLDSVEETKTQIKSLKNG